MKIYKVGGAVRDKLLGIESSDNDYVVVGGTPKELMKMGLIKVGSKFPVFIDKETREEYALARKERKEGQGYRGFVFEIENVTLKEDLIRRDLTINAMAEDEEGNLIDYFGGVQDLNNRILRHISEAFKEDPVRVLRLARFQATFPDFRIAPETKKIVLEILESGELDSLTKERVNLELQKLVKKSENPALFFETLQDLGVLETIFPNLKNFSKVAQKLEFVELLAILSLDLEENYFQERLRISKIEAKQINIFLIFYRVMNREFDAKDLMYLYRKIKKAEFLEFSYNIYKKANGKEIDFEKILKGLELYYSAPKELEKLEERPENIKKFLYGIRIERIKKLIDEV